MDHVFVGLPDGYETVFLYDRTTTDKRGHPVPVRQVLWGDFLWLDDAPDAPSDAEWTMVVWAPNSRESRSLLKIPTRHVTKTRPLEIIFVDVGIGDGAVLITPERNESERVIVIDAGKAEHMRKFLDGRFKTYRDGFHFYAAVVTHPDADHYNGFNKILSTSKITFDFLFHNGIVELNDKTTLEKVGGTRTIAGQTYLKRLFVDDAAMRAAFDPGQVPGNQYGKLVHKGITNQNVASFQMLGANLGPGENGRWWMPGFAPSDQRSYTIEVLGPWVEYPEGPSEPTLRVFDANLGKTKNGHSVLLRLQFGNFSVLFGGDLNRPSEKFLLQQYAGLDAWPEDGPARDAMVKAASTRLGADVMKSCHHGASDVTDEFLRAVNPAAFVISSGDEDANYVHPRPDLLGRLGKFGKGEAPVLLSTELQRSTRDIDNADLVKALTAKIQKLTACTAQSHADPAFAQDREKELADLLKQFASLALPSVSVDGAIYVKTDGKDLIAAFKKETQDPKSRWFYYRYELTGEGTLDLVQRSEH